MSGGGMLGGFLENRKLKQKRRMAHRLGYQGLQAMTRNDPDAAERSLSEAEAVLGELLRFVHESRAALHEPLPPADDVPISE